jgi:biopolymer transport protein TolR
VLDAGDAVFKKPMKPRFRLNLNTFTFTLSGILVLLMIVFMIQPTRFRHGVSIDLPKANVPVVMPGVDREDALIVSIHKDGTIYFATEKLIAEQLPAKIHKALKPGVERKVYIKADARTRYSNVAEVLDGVRAAGLENVAFIIEKRQPRALPQTLTM